MSSKEKIGKILADSIPRDLLLTFESLVPKALERARSIGGGFNPGHRRSVVGHNRHFALQEAFDAACNEACVAHNPLRGNRAIVGKSGIATILRLHLVEGKWDNSKRSKAKRKHCEPNRKVAEMIQRDIFDTASDEVELDSITAFLLTQGGGSEHSPVQTYVVVTSDEMDLRSPVFVEPVAVFLRRYQQVQGLTDNAQPTLKKGIKRQEDKGET